MQSLCLKKSIKSPDPLITLLSFLNFKIQILRIDDKIKMIIASNDRAHLILMVVLGTVGTEWFKTQFLLPRLLQGRIICAVKMFQMNSPAFPPNCPTFILSFSVNSPR